MRRPIFHWAPSGRPTLHRGDVDDCKHFDCQRARAFVQLVQRFEQTPAADLDADERADRGKQRTRADGARIIERAWKS